MKIFHYSRLEDWRDIQRGSWKSKDEPGLGASRRMGRDDMEAWRTGAVFALLEPEPANWVNNEQFKVTWDYLRGDIGPLLLEIDVDPEKDEVYVVDRGHVEGYLYQDKDGIPASYLHESRRDGERAYMESKIPLKQYLERADELHYSLPEVVITKNVPIERVSISENQPHLIEEMNRYKGEMKADLIREIKGIPELSEWYSKYKKETEMREGREGPALRQ